MSNRPKFDETFRNEMQARGHIVRCCWQVPGPKDTGVSGMEMLLIYGRDGMSTMALVQTFDGGGWEVYVPPSCFASVASRVEAVEAILSPNTPQR